MAGRRLLGVFVKPWRPGRAKSRLAGTVGPLAAALLYARMVRWLLVRWSRIGDERWLYCAPDLEKPWRPPDILDSWRCRYQVGNDLGERLQRAMLEAHCVADRVLIVGTDSPTLPDAWLERAWQWLAEVPVVIGPADDGGYYLIGCRRNVGDLWSGISWGGPDVLHQTLDRLEQLRLCYRLLPDWYDIDHFEDLKRLANDLRNNFPEDRHARRLLVKVERLLERHA